MRRERGAAAILFALALPILVGVIAFVTDLGYAYYSKQTLQDTLDLAAIAAARQLDGGTGATPAATTAARTVLDDNGFTDFSLASGCAIPTTDNAVFLCLGNYAARDSSGAFQYPLSSRFTAGGTKQKAVRLSAKGDSPSFFARIFGIDELDYSVQSTAARGGSNLAQLTIRSALVSANPNLVLGLLGGNGSLTVLGSNGIATANINLLTFLDALAPSVGVAAGNYDQVLGSQVSIGTLLTTAATVLGTGTTAGIELTGLNTAGSGLSAAIREANITLSDLIGVQTGTAAAGLDMTINALDLVQGGLMAANGVNGLQGGVGLGTSSSSILNGTATVTVKFAVVEPPQLSAIGDPALAKAATDQRFGAGAIYVRTGQVRVYISIQLPVLGPVTTAVNNLLASAPLVSDLVTALNQAASLNIAGLLSTVVGGLVGALLGSTQHKTVFGLEVLPTPRLDISIDLAGGEAYVTDYTCPTGNGTKDLTVRAASSAAIVRVGTMDAASVFASKVPVAVEPLPILNIWTRSGTFCKPPLLNLLARVPATHRRTMFTGMVRGSTMAAAGWACL
ncbi:pilus assembly protein TadG-related protein [Oleomonas cavernae]|nr:pilus assembly protein TadG-related protein [Oleomonas cavernae]